MIADTPPTAPAHDPRAQECVELQIVAELAGWKVGQRVNVLTARGLTLGAEIRSFTCDGEYGPLAIVRVHPVGWIEAVPLSALRAVPALVMQSPERLAEIRARARA